MEQQIEQLKNICTSLTADVEKAKQVIDQHHLEIIKLNALLEASKQTNNKNNQSNRAYSANLMGKKPPPAFDDKVRYEAWAKRLKSHLMGTLPEAVTLLDYAEA